MVYGRRRTEAHEKSMSSYELFAWRDAMSMACLVDELFGVGKAKTEFESVQIEARIDFEEKNAELIRGFIQKPESQRIAFLKRIIKESNEVTAILFAVLAIIGASRSRDVVEIRDRFRTVLVPGQGNRATTAALYEFAAEIHATFQYGWPFEPFDAVGLYDYEDE